MSLFFVHNSTFQFLGVRKCHSNLVNNAVAKLSLLIYGRNHPLYQKILYDRNVDLILMPKELQEVLENFVSSSETMTSGKCQGGDALLEEITKESKSSLKIAGVPSTEQWLHVFRNLN